ncbi:MAG: sugar transferase [Bacteroidales bacterium]|nr:sugar transferase [Bacteroidales bacterium]
MTTEKRTTLRYILCDTLSAALSWTALFAFRKLVLDPRAYTPSARPLDPSTLADPNLLLGILLVPAAWLALYTIQGTYRNVLRKARLKELLDTALASLLGSVAIFFILLLDDNTASYHDHYTAFLFLLAVHFSLTYLLRLLITSHTVRLVHSRQIGFPTLLIGSGSKAHHTYLDIENQETYSGNLFIGFVEVDPSQPQHSQTPSPQKADSLKPEDRHHNPQLTTLMPCLGTTRDLRTLVQQHDIQEVIIALQDNEHHLIAPILSQLNAAADLIIKVTPDARDLIVGSVKQQSIFHSPFIVINNRLMPEWQYSVKRIADVVLSLLAMLLLSPVYLATAIIVKATSPGPVFFTQERIGLHGRPFHMHKFRSMYIDAEQSGPALSKDNDPRITPFGHFMRKVRLDEIPQFYNVLRGTMSIVGPRPERQYYIDQITQRAPEYLLLQRIKPGITSWGQVKYGYASSVDQMVERLRYDLLYLDNMSITTDLKIMVYTAKIILQGRGK